jgi:hypothetical protein
MTPTVVGTPDAIGWEDAAQPTRTVVTMYQANTRQEAASKFIAVKQLPGKVSHLDV